MYALLQNNLSSIPTVVNVNSGDYVEKLMQGYQPIAVGYKKDMEALQENLTPEFENELDLNEFN